ncbi:sodium:solute symporter [Elusimicrobiota bacterium]
MAFFDWIVLAVYAATVISLGLWAGRREKNTEDYFLAGRQMHWLMVCISLYATSASALTFIGVPGAAYGGDFHYLQLAFGDLVGRLLISFLFLTAYYKNRVTTVYELLGKRFGPRSRDSGTSFFILTRLFASGVRIAGCAIALSVVFNMPINIAIVIIATTAFIYTVSGGIKAVIWTDLLQFILFIGGASIALLTIWFALPEGFSQYLSIGSAHEKFRVFHFSWNLNQPNAFIAGTLFGCFTSFAAFGTDQDMVQRMLTCKNIKDSQRAMILTAFLNFPITLLFLSVGAGLFVFYSIFPDQAVTAYETASRNDFIFPHFIKTVLGPGLRGLLVAGLLAASMSSLDSALNALASTAYIDIYKNYFNKHASDATAIKVSRIMVAAFALILGVIALLFSKTESILWLGFRIIGYTYGALLGIFILATATKKRGNDWGNVIAMVSSVFAVIFLTANSVGPLDGFRTGLFSLVGLTKIAWPWAIIIGTIWTFSVGALWPKPSRIK